MTCAGPEYSQSVSTLSAVTTAAREVETGNLRPILAITLTLRLHMSQQADQTSERNVGRLFGQQT